MKGDLDAHKTLLLLLNEEYKYDTERKRAFENRSNAFLGFSIATLAIIMNSQRETIYLSLKNLLANFYSYEGFWGGVNLLIFIISSIFLIYSMYCFIKVQGKVYSYKRLPPHPLIQLTISDKEESLFAMHVALFYEKAIAHNKILTDEKAVTFSKGVTFLILGFLGMIIWLVICVLSGY